MKEKIAKAALLIGCQVACCNAVCAWDGCGQTAWKPYKKEHGVCGPVTKTAQIDLDDLDLNKELEEETNDAFLAGEDMCDIPEVGSEPDSVSVSNSDAEVSRASEKSRKKSGGKKYMHRGRRKFKPHKNTGIKETADLSSDSCCVSSSPI